jgi:NAD(P)-dependent dehydrogenase (short-subunit alcohol dehydrogenase family)
MPLQNRVVVITGATGALGHVVARQFADQGANLALFSRSGEKLKTMMAKLELPTERAIISAVDIGDQQSLQSAISKVVDRFGRLDILIHLVGGWTGGSTVIDTDFDTVAEMLDQHFWTTYQLSRFALPQLLANRWGRLIVISTPFAGRPAAKLGAYSIAKAAQEALLLTLSEELKGSGVTANIIRVKTIDVAREKVTAPSAENAFWSTPEEISSAVLYLCTDQAAAINGARLPLYGSY